MDTVRDPQKGAVELGKIFQSALVALDQKPDGTIMYNHINVDVTTPQPNRGNHPGESRQSPVASQYPVGSGP